MGAAREEAARRVRQDLHPPPAGAPERSGTCRTAALGRPALGRPALGLPVQWAGAPVRNACRAHPCPTAWPFGPITVTHQRVAGCIPAARASSASTGPNAATSPGVSDVPRPGPPPKGAITPSLVG